MYLYMLVFRHVVLISHTCTDYISNSLLLLLEKHTHTQKQNYILFYVVILLNIRV